ncbi:MAG: hypothetical protein JNN20_18875 [Betaproteobacteria bacterium]|nr:hypothetical protein [Betaproteobacteria bacterium]
MLTWMIVWLPFAGAMAATMPLGWGSASSMIAGMSDNTDTGAAILAPCHGEKMGDGLLLGQSCSHCVLCHLAGALVTPHLPVLPSVAPTHIFTATPLAAHPSFVPELLVPPPRTRLA